MEVNSDIDGKDATVKEFIKDNINRFDAGLIGRWSAFANLNYRFSL